MRYLLLFIATTILNLTAISQVIPTDRSVDWSEFPQNIIIEQPVNQISVAEFGATGNGVTDDSQSIINAIESLNGSLGYVYFPSGTYLISQPLILDDSCILKGAGSDETTLLFDLNQNPINCISISRTQNTEFVEITGGLNKGNNLITVSNPESFNSGDYVEIRQKNGAWDIAPISWADYSVGQMTKVISVNGDKLLINSSLRIDYSEYLDPEIRSITPISNAGVQCLKIVRRDEPIDGAGSNIYINMAANCFVRGIESDTSVGAHVSIYYGLNILIDGCYFHHAFTYDGAGMRGYGVALSQHTSECLITNNIFRYLRHAMMIKTGSNGNIFSYNYSLEPHRTEPIPDASGDISFHGHYAFSNLWEGNIVQNIVIDHYWGPSGPYNTVFRNRAALWGIIMTTNSLQETNSQNFVGNEATNTELLHGMYNLSGEDHFEFGNNILGNIIPTGTNNLPDESYYLESKPEFWGQFLEWPTIGIPYELGSGTIPAKIRFDAGQGYTVCPDSLITNLSSNNHESINVTIWPNPTSDIINIGIENLETSFDINLIDQYGIIVRSIENITNSKNHEISTETLSNGFYILKIKTRLGTITRKLIILH